MSANILIPYLSRPIRVKNFLILFCIPSTLRPALGICYSLAILMRVGENYVRCFFGDHVNRHDHKEAGNFGEPGRVGNAQPLDTVPPEIAAQDAALLLRADRTGARGMMAPGTVLDELVDTGIAL